MTFKDLSIRGIVVFSVACFITQNRFSSEALAQGVENQQAANIKTSKAVVFCRKPMGIPGWLTSFTFFIPENKNIEVTAEPVTISGTVVMQVIEFDAPTKMGTYADVDIIFLRTTRQVPTAENNGNTVTRDFVSASAKNLGKTALGDVSTISGTSGNKGGINEATDFNCYFDFAIANK